MFSRFESPETGRELRHCLRRAAAADGVAAIGAISRIRETEIFVMFGGWPRAAAADGVAAIGAIPRVCVTENFVMFGGWPRAAPAAFAALRPLTALPPSARFRA